MAQFNDTRRGWLKKSALMAGAAFVAPHLSFATTSCQYSIELDAYGDIPYSPLFKEYVPEDIYTPIKVRLSANENPYGPSPKTLEAFKASAVKGNRYGWFELMDLAEKIAKKEGVTVKNLVMGAGSTELLEKTAQSIFADGGNLVSANPTFMSIVRTTRAMGGEWKPVALTDDWQHDLMELEAAIDDQTKLVYLCNPNNPTGTMTDHKALKAFCSRVSEKVPVFVDEAYMDFLEDGTEKSMISLIKEGKNVMVARTFSKIYGMAGLRVGYLMGQEESLKKIKASTLTGFGITAPSVQAALTAMDDADFVKKSRTLNAECREYVYKCLTGMGITYVPSHTSFIIFPLKTHGKSFLSKMTQHGVGVRAFQFYDRDWCRVSMGTLEEMKKFAAALEKVGV